MEEIYTYLRAFINLYTDFEEAFLNEAVNLSNSALTLLELNTSNTMDNTKAYPIFDVFTTHCQSNAILA